jgi:hypothetical protein
VSIFCSVDQGCQPVTIRTRKPSSGSASIADKLLEVVESIDRPAEFCTSGQFPSTLPGLVVNGLGDIGLPLSAAEAKRLIKVCKQAPYGKGTETVVDTKVRKVWELDPDFFSLENPKWETTLDSVLRDVECRLGLPKQSLAASLYKLLVYEKGSFFLPHRDGEKLDRMVATLVINLPSKHTGGELVVFHQGQQEVIAMPEAASGLEADYAAFYADCQHEVKPLLSGYRLCLTYNLVLSKPRSKISTTAPDFEDTSERIAAVLSDWETKSNKQAPAPKKLAVMLEHRYTQSGLSIDKLKGVDLAKAKVLFDVAEKADCDAYLALVTLWQSGAAEGGYDNYGYGSRRRRRYWDDDEDEDDEDSDFDSSSGHTMGEIFDYSLSANHWSNRQGKKVAFGRIPLEESEIVPKDALTETEPSREDFEGYTGNAGMTLERWYHRAAIVLWPRDHQFQVWCEAGTDAAIAGLNQMIANVKKSKKGQEERRAACQTFAEQIIETWQPGRSGYYWDPSEPDATKPETVDRESIWITLAELNEPRLVVRLIEDVMPKDAKLSLSASILKWMAKQGWTTFSEPLISLMTRTTKETLARNIVAFRQIATLLSPNSDHKTLCNQLATIITEAIERIDSSQCSSWDAPKLDRKEVIIDMARSFIAIGDDKLLNRFLTWHSIHPLYNPIEVMVPASIKLVSTLKQQAKGNRPIRNWVNDILKELRSRTRTAPAKPTNWKRDSEIASCKCADCKRLSAFLADPTQPEARFPLAKQRRQHLHGIIDRHHLDCTHKTLRVGSPQVLVCKKTTASYERACKVYEQDLKHLAAIRKVSTAFA